VRPAVEPVGATIERTLRTADGRDRTYRLYVPRSLPADTPVPLLVALHGGTGSGSQFQVTSAFDGLAEANGFLVAFPDGIGTGPTETALRTWNGGSCCGPATAKQVDDVAFVEQLLDDVAALFPVDPERTFAAGHSNGGIMSYRLACELSGRIVAIGLQAGSLGIDRCTPAQPVSVFHLHGTADRNHPIEGGIGADSIAGVSFRSAAASVQTLAAANGCDPAPSTTTNPINPDLTTFTWSGCDGGVEVVLAVVDGADHAWMGHPSPRPGAAPYPDLDASIAVWSFLAAHPRRTVEG
jgi:polyhydroxybutyrate depolymerase